MFTVNFIEEINIYMKHIKEVEFQIVNLNEV